MSNIVARVSTTNVWLTKSAVYYPTNPAIGVGEFYLQDALAKIAGEIGVFGHLAQIPHPPPYLVSAPIRIIKHKLLPTFGTTLWRYRYDYLY